ncbi:MAG: MBL fold metallo-hydrolase [Lachnospiraceae bacterium]|nr:MBL fold metallo-hydrolase [Lachnospiraceae bacterium]
MFELHQAGKNTYYVDCYAKVGIYTMENGEVYFIDSGTDDKEAEALFQILQEKHWKLKAILLTHGHSDHTGGCAFLQEHTHCEVFASSAERIFGDYPFLSPTYITGGYPPREMQNEFLLSRKFQAKDIEDAELPEGIKIIPLPGHNFQMIGVRTDDDVVFLADSIYSKLMLNKYHINFVYDVPAFVKTLDQIGKMEAKLFVPSHTEPEQDIRNLVKLNKDKIDEIAKYIIDFCETPITYDELIRRLFDVYGRKLNMQQYYLVGFTVHSFLSWLKDTGCIQTLFEDNMLCWRSWHAG